MNDCKYHLYLGPYHDGELDADLCRQLELHLATCPACAADLAAIRDLSACIAGAGLDPMERPELLRMHAAVDRAQAADLAGRQVLRTAGLLGALAASILIISGVWLLDALPSGSKPTAGGDTSVALAPDWERVAITLRADPRPGLADDSLFSPRYAAAVDWMLSSLAPTERRSWAKRNS